MRFCLLLLLLAPLTAAALPPEQEAFWQQLRTLCGKAFEGKIVESTSATDAQFTGQRLIMHVRACGEGEILVPFHVGENRSRTWIITRTATGLRLKHDHRHEDGTADKITQYGGDTTAAGLNTRQEFPADTYTASLIPAAKTNVWRLSLEPGKRFVYALRRDSDGRRFTVEFDLSRTIAAPPPPWGHQ